MTPALQKTLVAVREYRDIIIKTIGEIEEVKV